MYAVSYYTRTNGIRVLHWRNSSKLNRVYRIAILLTGTGAEDICIEWPNGTCTAV